MERPTSISDYLRAFATELGQRILDSFPPLHGAQDPPSPLLSKLLRRPYPAQSVAILGVVKRLAEARSAAVVAECGTGKTLILLASLFVASGGRPFVTLAMVPSHLNPKWLREGLTTIPGLRAFVIDGLRNANSTSSNGIHEVKLRAGRIVRAGFKTTLTDLRLRRNYPSARARWNALCPQPALFVLSKETGKLSYFWRHAYSVAQSGRFQGSVVNPDSGQPIYSGDDDERLLSSDFKKVRLSEWLGANSGADEPDLKARRKLFSALWQADRSKVRRYAVIEFIGRHLRNFFDFAIADEVHELKGSDTAQGNALGTLASAARKTLVLTGTLLGGYADDAYEILFRLEPNKMIEHGYEHHEGVRPFMENLRLARNHHHDRAGGERVFRIQGDAACAPASRCVAASFRRLPDAAGRVPLPRGYRSSPTSLP